MRQFNTIFCAAVISALCAPSGYAQQQGVAWQPDIATAQQIAGKTNKLVLMHFWAPSCVPCMQLEQEVFSRPETAQSLNAKFVCVKVNTDEAVAVARTYNVSMLPTDVVLSADGRLIAQFRSPSAANQYLQQLNQVADGYRQPSGQIANYSNDRYADYLRQRQAEANGAVADGGAGVNHAVGATTDYAIARHAPPPVGPAPPPMQAQSPVVPGTYPPQIPATSEQRTQSPAVQQIPPRVAAIQLPPGSPPLALDGYCTVLLKEQKRWGVGDRRWGAIHRGRTYLFTGPAEQKKFLESPDTYAPVMSGNDPVLALDGGQAIPGKREHGVFFENRVYLFSDESSLARFYQNPGRYAAEVMQAMR